MSLIQVSRVLLRCQQHTIPGRLKLWQMDTTIKTNKNIYFGCLRYSSNDSSKHVSIGDIKKVLKQPQNPELVPVKYICSNPSQAVLRHLRWIMQKDLLEQDVFLIGSPGPIRRQLAMMYLELTKREVEYVSLSRDTSESDLKQRREILAGNAFYVDQCAVNAAVKGRVLVLEGIEKAERNVLPVLNNLLENREMQLEDGRFLVAASRYDQLLEDYSKEELDKQNLVRVHEDFRVIALGLPVPRYKGNPLDPPLRSRFQARGISALPFKEHLEMLQEIGPKISSNKLSLMLSFGTTLLTEESVSLGLPDFPIDNLSAMIAVLNSHPHLSLTDVIYRIYPYNMFLNKEGIAAVEGTMKKFDLVDHRSREAMDVTNVDKSGMYATVHMKSGSDTSHCKVPAGLNDFSTSGTERFVKNTYHNGMLAEMLQSHQVRDFCLIGPKGCGKSVLVENFANYLGYHIEPVHLHQDMTSRDLLQQRSTRPNGDTFWVSSPLVSAALQGNLAVLDGVHRINPGSFSVIQRLIHDRELQLYDGTRLLHADRYNQIKESTGKTDTELSESGILPIHPSFRIIALAEPPVIGSTKQQWLSPELLSMFLFHRIRPLALIEEELVLKTLVPNCPDMTVLLKFVHNMRASTDPAFVSLASSLSTRQLLRIAHRLANFPSEDLGSIIQKACLSKFLPRMVRLSLEQALQDAGLETSTNMKFTNLEEATTCEVKDGMVRIRNTKLPVCKPDNITKVPNILFYENNQHLIVMEDMLKDYSLGEHLLLVGNQGVGKNKIVDRFLQLLNQPREYIQLHRDTTVQTLTLQPTVLNGVIMYEDSPLVRAVKEGHVLVIDEADKAPTHVTCILKTLVESGEMHMADGRKIVSANSRVPPSEKTIVTHPNFRMIVLANRPGFPFLGNDFFGAVGDIFSCHGIDNPDMDSEIAMLQQYGPDVSNNILRKLVLAFGELRNLADQGLINYPYSTREVVNMIKHLQKFPNEGLTTVLKNVFDFDAYNEELRGTIIDIMAKHGIPLEASDSQVKLTKELPLPKFERLGQWRVASSGIRQQNIFSCPVTTKPLDIKGPLPLPQEVITIDRTESRSNTFTEREAQCLLPLDEGNIVADLAVTKAEHRSAGQSIKDMIHVATCNPISVISIDAKSVHGKLTELYELFPPVSMAYRPKVKLTALSAPLDDTLILHEECTNALMSLNYETGEVARLKSEYLPEIAIEKRKFLQYGVKPKKNNPFVMLGSTLPDSNIITFYKENSDTVILVDPLQCLSHQVILPVKIRCLQIVDANKWIITDSSTNQKYLLTSKEADQFRLQFIEEHDGEIDNEITAATSRPCDEITVKKILGDDTSAGPNRLLTTPDTYAVLTLGFPPNSETTTNEVYQIPRGEQTYVSNDDFLSLHKLRQHVPPQSSVPVLLPESGQVVRAIEPEYVPKSAEVTKNDLLDAAGFLEIADLVNKKLRYLNVPSSGRSPPYSFWLMQPADTSLKLASLSGEGLVTVDSSGYVQLWETSLVHLQRSLQEWRNMIGYEDTRPLHINYERDSGKSAEFPKHGKIDPENAPHVGGNTWAGGTGGRDTAGLGGIGGPYRLDSGHNVFQVSQAEKDAVPEEVRRAAQEMAAKAFKERLREINMSEYDAETYDSFAQSVRRQVQSLRVILDTLQAKGKERQWLKQQPQGDLDETKLIEGIAGEKAIYKRRGEQEPELGAPMELPKRLRLVVDVSGSMYRFNGHDRRLEREMSAVLMVMEALEGYDTKLKYEIFGHSGENYDAPFVKADQAPKNKKERLVVLKTMHAHSQFCLSGDNTLEATKHAIDSVAKEEADEHFVIILSDANFERYGISARKFSELLTENKEVNAFAIFIGSLGDQAVRLTKQLPMGRAFVCMDTDKLPQILQQIFSSTMLSSD
ncbi:von Willebrand factor A domain-containing protein 8 [Octopus sinensis]|uniref:von Willebrand factor A domain-containing protein 8 n=1 Tax=Octopus sinensis TaxID=2607531 RepID=A0A6P7T7G4_9MOLL|nr:von Willebrand factor A domain-containing protein 8 [Octopus sinensis]